MTFHINEHTVDGSLLLSPLEITQEFKHDPQILGRFNNIHGSMNMYYQTM